MCTVSFIPINKGFVFTSNRDEAPSRKSDGIVSSVINGKTIRFPRDKKASGTWIAISNTNQLVCILNGAFVKHKHLPPYRKSRGLMALEFFEFDSAKQFFKVYQFEEMEPFTMIIFDRGDLYEFRWDENEKSIKELNTTDKHIWSSCTLYSDDWVQKRLDWFEQWSKDKPFVDLESALDFHKNGGDGSLEYDTVMNRQEIVRTISITSVENFDGEMTIRYENLLDGAVFKR